MEELTQNQKALRDSFINVLKDKQKASDLQKILNLVENNGLQDILNKIDEIKEFYNGNKEKDLMSIEEIREDIESSQKGIDEVYWQVFKQNEKGEIKSQALIDIQDAQDKAKIMQQSYQQFYDTKDSQGNITQGIITKLTEACQQIEQNKDKIANLQNFYAEVFEGIKENNQTIRQPLDKILNASIKQLEELHKTKGEELDKLKQQKERELFDLHQSKKDEIDELLPGATSAGLAKAYNNEKIAIQKSIAWWNWVFVISIVVFIGVFALYFYLAFQDNFTYVSFLKSFPFWVFSGFFTLYSTKQIAEYKRMASEYAYKERLNETYTGYKAQIESMEDEELKKKLAEIMLDSAMLNPSDKIYSKGEIPSLSFIEKTINTLPFDILKKAYEMIGNKLKTIKDSN